MMIYPRSSPTRALHPLLPALFALASCSGPQFTTSVPDDVYFAPGQAPLLVSSTPAAPLGDDGAPATTDDYYDPNVAPRAGSDFYDIAYNDPYFYNYGRFGLNSGPMGWQNGWNGPGWGTGMGWGSPMYPGFGQGWGWNMGVGMGGWNSPWGWGGGMGWGSPWGTGWGGSGWGYGLYQGPWGACYSCYAPIIIGDGWNGNTIVRHRNSLGSGSNGQPNRPAYRNPVGLAPQPYLMRKPATGQQRTLPADAGRTRQAPPARSRTTTPVRTRTTPDREVGPGVDRAIERTFPSRDGGFGGGGSSPSRGGGGGGTRTSPRR